MDLGGGAEVKIKLSEYGHVANQIKADDTGSNMVANILPTDTPSTQGVGSKGQTISFSESSHHGLQSLPPSPKRAERKGRRRPFREAGSGHKQWNTVSCVDTFSIISKFSAQNSKI